MVIAWGISEVVRYGFYALNLLFKKAPYFSLWIRYTFFYVLYPLGAGSEFMLIQLAIPLSKSNLPLYLALTVSAGLYPPGFYFMYTHMIKQRKKYLVDAFKPKKE